MTLEFSSLPSLAGNDESYQCVIGVRHIVSATVAASDNSLLCYIPLDTVSFALDNGRNPLFAINIRKFMTTTTMVTMTL